MSFRTVVNVIGAGKGPDGRDFAEKRMRRNGSIDRRAPKEPQQVGDSRPIGRKPNRERVLQDGWQRLYAHRQFSSV
jgi:hypothetical protein